jgi:hypothetical protein
VVKGDRVRVKDDVPHYGGLRGLVKLANDKTALVRLDGWNTYSILPFSIKDELDLEEVPHAND